MTRLHHKVFSIALLSLLGVGFITVLIWGIPFTYALGDKTQVLFLGDYQGRLSTAVSLDTKLIEVTVQSSDEIDLSLLNQFKCVILNDVNLSSTQIATLSTWTNETGNGLVLLTGPVMTEGTTLLQEFGFTNVTTFNNNTYNMVDPTDNDEFNKHKGLSIERTESTIKANPLVKNIVWNTAPELFYFSLIPNLKPGVVHYVDMQWNDAALNEQDKTLHRKYPILAGIPSGINENPNIFLFTGWLQFEFETKNANQHFMLWPYFNYLFYMLIQSSTGNEILNYGKWEFSPVPHLGGQIAMGVFVLTALILCIVLFRVARKKGKQNLQYFQTPEKDLLKTETTKPEECPEPTPSEEKQVAHKLVSKSNFWEKIGFHRQLSGFLNLYFLMMLLIVPQLLISTIVMPQFINPFPQSSGWYSYTLHFFEAIWLFFDMGFNYAITKYFAQYRLEKPEKAYHYVQIFIWYEFFSGVVQITLFAFIGSIVFPLTNLNYLSWMLVVHSIVQVPGIFLVFQYLFQGMQRSNFQMISYALQAFVLRLVLQVATIPLFRFIFQSNPIYGAAFGTSIGLLVGQLLGDWCLFFITWKMYRKLLFPSRPIFYADFTKQEFFETLKFGVKMVLGEMWVPLVWFWQVWLTVNFIPNSSQEQGYFELAFTIAQVPMACALLTSSLLGAITEAHQYKKQNLLNYNTISGFKWSFTFTLYLAAAFLAIGRTFVIGASGPIWIKSALLLPLFMLARLGGPFTWMSDNVFAGTGKPIYAGIAWILENIIKAGLMLLFIILPPISIAGVVIPFGTIQALLWAYIISLYIKDIYVMITMRKKLYKWDWNVWPTYVAPFLSAAMVFGIFTGLDYLLVTVLGLGQGIISAMILLILVLFLGEYVHSFLYAFVGGYDQNTLNELDISSKNVQGTRGFARLYYHAARLGAKISPLHGRFPIKVYEQAIQEAQELTDIKCDITQNTNS